MNHFKNFLYGMGQVLILDTGARYIRPERGDFAKDSAALRGDCARVAIGLTKNTQRYGKQAYLRKS